jgi:hypothetical protein
MALFLLTPQLLGLRADFLDNLECIYNVGI